MTSQPSSPSSSSSRTIMLQRSDSAKQFAEEHWNRASAVLSARPSLMTQSVLILVLKNRPPFHVVQKMLSLNPNAADIPSNGPSPLQVAVRYEASVDVIRAVIQANPLQLVSTHSGYDPLMYAKIWRRSEPELLELLSRPLSYWTEEGAKTRTIVGDARSIGDSNASIAASTTTTISTATNTSTPPTSPRSSRRQRYQHSQFVTNDEEMNNIKTIAATIVRAQKKQVQTLQKYRQDIQSSIQSSSDRNHQERLDQLQRLEEMQQRHFKAQLIALDMKEKRIMARVKKMERRVHKTLELSKNVRQVKEQRQDVELQKMNRNVESVARTLDTFSARTSKRLEMTELRLEQESRVNDYFRNDTRLQLDQLDFRASALQGWSAASVDSMDSMTPVVYATPYLVEEDDDDDFDQSEHVYGDAEVVPLFPKPLHHATVRSCGRNQKRSYPKRKRSRRNLLGALNF